MNGKDFIANVNVIVYPLFWVNHLERNMEILSVIIFVAFYIIVEKILW